MIISRRVLSMSANHTPQGISESSLVSVHDAASAVIMLTHRLADLPQVLAPARQENLCLFYALSRERSGLRDFLADLVEKCHEQVPSFGQQTLNALQNNTRRTSDLADAFAADLANVETNCNMLILDHFDNLILDEET